MTGATKVSLADYFRQQPPREIAVVMLSALGDAVHVLPVLNALKRAYPGARITWIVQPVPFTFAQGHPAVDELIVFQRRRGRRAFEPYGELRGRLGGRRFDLVLNLQVYLKAGLITRLLNSDVKLGFDRKRARDLNWLFTSHRIPARPSGHVQDQYLEFLEHLGVSAAPIEWRIHLSEAEQAAQKAFFAPIQRPVCAVVVGTSKPEKNWPPERYARLIDRIERLHGMRCVLVGGPSSVERAAASEIMARAQQRPIDALGDDVRRMVYLIAGSRLVVSPDTGPLHIARALDVPVVGLYGYSNPKRYGPYRKFTDLIVDGYARFSGEEYRPSMEWRAGGMKRVTVEMVNEKVALAIEKYLKA